MVEVSLNCNSLIIVVDMAGGNRPQILNMPHSSIPDNLHLYIPYIEFNKIFQYWQNLVVI